MPALPPIIHPEVRAGLERIRRRRRVAVAVIFGGPVIGAVIMAFLVPTPVVLVFWFAAALMMFFLLWWSRCPRCENFYFDGMVFFFFPWIEMFRRRCRHCGLDMRQLKRRV